MKSTDRKRQAVLLQRDKALRLGKALSKDNSLLLTMIERLTSLNSEADQQQLDAMKRALSNVIAFFRLDTEMSQALTDMISLSFLGRRIQLSPQADDPYAFAQVEWLLKDSEYFSVLGVAMKLSLEKYDGSGPQSLQQEVIPPLSSAFRCLLVFAELSLLYEDSNVLINSMKKALVPYLDPRTIAEFLHEFSLGKYDYEVSWVEPAQLVDGMTVLENVRNSEGLLLIAKHTILTQSLIESLLNYDGTQRLTHKIPVYSD
jgi:hypothetical protein